MYCSSPHELDVVRCGKRSSPGSHCSSRPGASIRTLAIAVAAAISSSSKDRYGDIRPMPIKIITVSKGASRSATELAEEWTAKLRR